jgi:PAS domain S-box-containing protein
MPGISETETLLGTIVEGLGQPFYAVDHDWRFTIFNDEAARYFGLAKLQVLGKRLWDIFPHEVHAERGRILLDAMARREIVRGETLSMVKARWVSYCLFPLGEGMGVIFREVTDRKRAEERRDAAEEALRKRTMELEVVLETIPTAVVFTYDPRARSLVANRRAIDLLRLPKRTDVSLSAQLHSWPAHRFLRDGQPLGVDQLPLQRAVRGEAVEDEVLEVVFDDGERRMLLVRSVSLRTSRGDIQGAVCAVADVTDRYRYEQHLKLMLNELNHRVKNTLAVVQSIATLTLKDIEPALPHDFEQRLLTLSPCTACSPMQPGKGRTFAMWYAPRSRPISAVGASGCCSRARISECGPRAPSPFPSPCTSSEPTPQNTALCRQTPARSRCTGRCRTVASNCAGRKAAARLSSRPKARGSARA